MLGDGLVVKVRRVPAELGGQFSTQPLVVVATGHLLAVLADLGLRRLGDGLWHRFPGPGGVTGLILLTESHLACHTYPESGVATFNLYCCRPRPSWPWEERLRQLLGATHVVVRCLSRPASTREEGAS